LEGPSTNELKKLVLPRTGDNNVGKEKNFVKGCSTGKKKVLFQSINLTNREKEGKKVVGRLYGGKKMTAKREKSP